MPLSLHGRWSACMRGVLCPGKLLKGGRKEAGGGVGKEACLRAVPRVQVHLKQETKAALC